MVTIPQRNQGDGDKYTAATAIASNVLRSLVTAVTKAMTTAIANAMVPVAATPNTITYSSSIYLYNNKPFEMKTKEGKCWWHLINKTAKGHKIMESLLPLSMPTRSWTSSRIIPPRLDWKTS